LRIDVNHDGLAEAFREHFFLLSGKEIFFFIVIRMQSFHHFWSGENHEP
jgi:hypothetical protein